MNNTEGEDEAGFTGGFDASHIKGLKDVISGLTLEDFKKSFSLAESHSYAKTFLILNAKVLGDKFYDGEPAAIKEILSVGKTVEKNVNDRITLESRSAKNQIHYFDSDNSSNSVEKSPFDYYENFMTFSRILDETSNGKFITAASVKETLKKICPLWPFCD